MDYSLIIIAGFGGGVIRGLVGFIKHQYSYKKVGFDVPYFFTMMFISGVVGSIVTVAVGGINADFLQIPFSPALAVIAGYAGGDLLENLYKILFKKVDI